eukprot:TRINITY_DN12590_c0_g1_i16.p1 TRINITY_DN12590_c0_g1~~TRINITY_DN12590_c0_g1_i16.p1  ORF type:complete len:144 (-),score=15.85 TRINITY_DN12590_c0_g1_i16:48-479(-)
MCIRDSFKTSLVWVAQSIYQGAVVTLSTFILFDDSFVNIVIINFSALILIEMLNLYSVIKKPTYLTYIVILLSMLIYASSIFIFRNYFNLTTIDQSFLLKILFITAIAWLPIHIIKFSFEKCDPSEAARVEPMGVCSHYTINL